MQTVLCRQKGGHGPARFMGRPRKLGIRTRHSSLVTECCFFAKNVLTSIAPCTFILHTKLSFFSRNGRSSNYVLESQPGELLLETFS